MRRSRTRKLGRIKRGEHYAPGRYWLAFMICSVFVHAVTMAVMSDAALSFIQTLKKPAPPAEALTYVNIFYAGPAPLPSSEAPQAATTAAPAVRARARSRARGKAAPEKLPAKKPDVLKEEISNTPLPPLPVLPERPDDDAVNVEVASVTKLMHEKKPRTVKEPEKLDTATRETAVLEGVEPGTIQMITGTKKTSVSLADLHRDDTSSKTLSRYSSVRTVPAVPSPSKTPDFALRRDNPQEKPVVAPAPGRLDSLAQTKPPAQDRVVEEALPPLAAVMKALDNSSSIGGPGPDVMQPDDKEPLASSQPPALQLHTSIPPPQAVTGTLATNADKPAVLSEAARTQPQAAPQPSPTKVITVKGAEENTGKPPEIKITSPKPGVTDKSLVDIAGTVAGEGITSVTLSIRGEDRELLVRDGTFRATAQLDEGKNEITAKALDKEGRASKDSVSVSYVPAFTAARISFTSPVNDGTIDAINQKGLLISGAVEGRGIGTVRVYLNKTVMDIEVKDGRFSRTVPIEAEQNMLYAEASDGRKTYRSEKIQFRVLNLYPKDLAVRMAFTGKGDAPRLKYRYVPHPLSKDTGSIPAPPEFLADGGPDGGVVSVGEARPGIYTVGVEYDMGPGEVREATFKVTLYGYDPGRKKTRTIGPVKLMGKGYLPAVRVLLPEEVFWEDESWFSGRVESGQGTMKYREPEGIQWKEEE